MCQFGGDGMRGRARLLGLVVAACALFSGCKTKTTVGITLAPTSATVLVGTTTQFTATATNGGAVNWSVNGVANGNTTVGTISTSGLYTAPPFGAGHSGDPADPDCHQCNRDLAVRFRRSQPRQKRHAGLGRSAWPSRPQALRWAQAGTLQFSATVTGVPLGARPSSTFAMLFRRLLRRCRTAIQ